MNAPEIETLFDADTIRRRVADLGAELDREIGKNDPVVVSLLGGSVVFLADLLRAIRAPLRFEFIQVEYSEPEQDRPREIHFPIPLDLAGQNLLVLKDIVSTGVIETYLQQQLRQHGARSVQFAALLDVPSERRAAFAVDYSAFTVQRHGTFVGYGLKYHGRHGNLPTIGRVLERES